MRARHEPKYKVKNLKKVHLRNHNRCFFTCSSRPPTLSQRHMDLHVWAYPRHGYIFQVSSKSVQEFRSPRESKFGLSHYFGYWFLQQLVLPYKPWSKVNQFAKFFYCTHQKLHLTLYTQYHHKSTKRSLLPSQCLIKLNNKFDMCHKKIFQQWFHLLTLPHIK